MLEIELTARETAVMFLTQFPNIRLSTERENTSWLLWAMDDTKITNGIIINKH